MVWGCGFRVEDSRLRVQILGFRVEGLGFRGWDSGFRVLLAHGSAEVLVLEG